MARKTPIVDIHVHSSNKPMIGLHTADASIDAIDRYADQYDIRKVLVIATYFPFLNKGVRNFDMLSRIQGRDRFSMIGSLDVMNDYKNGLAQLEGLAKAKLIVAIKLFPGYQTFRVSNPEFYGIFHLARKYGLPVVIHGGELHHCCSKERRASGDLKCGLDYCQIDRNSKLSHPYSFFEAIREFSDVKFVICHLANPHFKELRRLMRACPNVYTDISGQYLSGTDEDSVKYRKMIARQLRWFLELDKGRGIDHVMFGSDFPIQSFADTIALVDMLKLSDSAKQKVLWQNANTVFKLGLGLKGRK